jgi:hypothetical protein
MLAHIGPGINHLVLLFFHREGQNHQRANAICWKLGYPGTTSSCRGGRPPEASGGIVNHNRREEFNVQADTPQPQLMLEIRDNQISDEDR